MKKIILISSIVASTMGMVNAQAKQTAAPVKAEVVNKETRPEVRAKERVAEINNLCALKGDQFGKVNNVFIDYFTKQDALNAKQTKLTASDYNKQLDELKGQRDAAVKAILSADQVAMLQKAKSAAAAKPAGN
jgi:hypothetical protein